MAQDNIADLLKGMGNQGDGLQTRVWGPPFYPLPYQRRYRKKWPQMVDAVVA